MMMEESEARDRITRLSGRGVPREMALREALGAFLCEDFFARLDMPPFDNSSVDGYALGGEGCLGAAFTVVGLQAAGRDQELVLGAGEAARIFTGAPVPRGCVCVVMQEDVTREGNTLILKEKCISSENIRCRGTDFFTGDLLLEKGVRISSRVVAVLASQGMDRVWAVVAPVVGILTTGDEIVPAGQTLWLGAIYESNAPMLESLFHQAGVRQIHVCHVRDDPEELREVVAGLLERCDFLFTVGGVSVGEKDYVRMVLRDLGVKEDFWRIRLKPGKPLLFGVWEGGRRSVVFGLPGNPVSAWSMAVLFGLPALRAWRGGVAVSPGRTITARAGVALSNDGDRPHYLRGNLLENGMWYPSGLQRSDALLSLARSDALARLSEQSTVSVGEALEVILVED